MPAILPNYEYDIFISYRQNDNKRDGWVTNFVEALKDELEATLKNPVSIYFDENPHDGLLESHQVGASLEKKLKCLVFIPIISQTYCDTGCFAWEHEFLPFIKMAREDSLGMDVTLENGNVASRVLPIKIHELDSEDLQTLDNLLDGPMRSIDFIYKEPGVNRALKPSDERSLNLEKTDYQNQINKVANSLKEIGRGMLSSAEPKNTSKPEEELGISQVIPKGKKSKAPNKIVLTSLLIAVVLMLSYFVYDKYYQSTGTSEVVDKSIAVLPFRNDSNDPANIYFCNGLMEDIINQLSQIPNVRVPSATSMLYYRDNPMPYEDIIDELGVSYLLEASVRKTADKAIMNITLIDAAQNEQVWSERMEMDLSVKDIFEVQFEVAKAVANKMRIAMDNSKTELPTSSYEAYDNYIMARDLMQIWSLDKNRAALNLLLKAIQLDEDFQNAFVLLGQGYGQRAELSDGGPWVDSARHYATVALNKNNQDAGAINALGYSYVLEGKPKEGLKLYLEAYIINPNVPFNYAGWCYYQLGEFGKAIKNAAQNIKRDPKNSIYYVDMANATNSLGLFDYSEYYSNKALEINASHTFVYDNLKDMEVYKGNYKKALEHQRRISVVSKSPKDEALLGIIYYKMGDLEQAKKYLDIDFRGLINEESGDENSKIELYFILQQRALVSIKLGYVAHGKTELEELSTSINNNLTNDRPEKYLLLAAGYATLGESAKSLENLNIVLDMGYNDYYAVINNALLDPLHGNPNYETLIQNIKDRNDKMREDILQQGILTK